MIRQIGVLLLSLTVLLSACEQRQTVYRSQALQGGGQVQGQSGLDASAFDLQTAIGLLRTNKVKDAQSLEAAINDPSSGINNVDVDKDGKIDYIGIEETQGGTREFKFMAIPSSGVGDPVQIASVTITDNGQQYQVAGGYTSVVNGYDSMYYSYAVPRLSLGDALFIAWLATPSRGYYGYRNYGYYNHYQPRPYMSASSVSSTRTTYQTTTHVAPIVRQAPPASYAQKAAVKMPSTLAAKPVGAGLQGRAQGMSDFKPTNTNVPRPAATGFGGGSKPAAPSSSWGSSKPAAPSYSPPASKPSSGGFFGGGSSKPSSSGWGSSKPSSGGGFGSSRPSSSSSSSSRGRR